MKCLTNLVGLDGCDSSTAPFKLNQIGFSKNQLVEMMDDSYSTVDDFLLANKEIAAAMVISDFFGMVSGGSFSKQVIDSGIAGAYAEQTVLDSVTGLRGVSIKVYGQSEYWRINIGYVTLFSDYTGDVPVSLYDLTTGAILETKTFPLIAGQITRIDFNYAYDSNLTQANLFIGYDTTGINPYLSKVNFNTCCGKKPSCSSGVATLQGGEITSPFYYNSVTHKDTTAGLTVQYNIECNNEAYLCSIRSVLGLAMLYRTAMSILDYSKDSGGQFSEQKTINAEGNEDRWTRSEYLYNQELKKITNRVQLPTNKCFSCGRRISFKTSLPG